MRRELEVIRLGRVGYADAFAMQVERRDAILRGDATDALFLLEHSPVFTLGRNAAEKDILAGADWLRQNGVEVHESDRGGQVTYHGPGQLVGYPVLNLSPDRRDVRRYVRDLQAMIVQVLKVWGIGARGGEGDRIGVWTSEEQPRKIASIGIHLKRWVTTHGFALNVATDLAHFQGIVACGLHNVQMVTMEELVDQGPSLDRVSDAVAEAFCSVFDYPLPAPTLDISANPSEPKS